MSVEKEDQSGEGRTVLRNLWEHHWWSLDQLIGVARELSEEEFTRSLALSYGSFHGALAHLVGSEQVWLARVKDGESLAAVPGGSELPNLAAIERAWEHLKQNWRAIFDADDLGRIIRYRNTKGTEFDDPLWLVLAHLVDHGAAYRGMLIAALRLLGRTPPTTGLITYTRQKKN
jgi:uncharacterized damage-inducible protein DinB